MLRGTVWVAAAALAAMCLAPTHGAGADGWCGPAAYNGTRCNATVATCCDFHWSPNGKGCCAMPNAVCCANGYTCCPEGHTCQDQGSGWGVVTTCVPSGAAGAAGGDGAGLLGEQICKPGPPLPLDPARKNVVVMGDSVSIGYTPAVAAALSDVADVQHSPWGGDGGACETAYGEQCLDYFLSSPSGVQLVPDVLYFNWGLHNIGTTVVPGQGSTPQLYLPSLTNIVRRLKALASSNGGKPKLIFGITSPMLCDAASDDKVLGLNKQAVALMQSNQIPTVDLHAAVVGKCGPVPTSTCFNHSDCFCPHCTSEAYAWLADSTVAPAIRKLL